MELFSSGQDAAFWDRPPEEVHRDILERSGKVLPRLTPEFIAIVNAGESGVSALKNEVARARELISQLPEGVQGIAKLLPLRLISDFIMISEDERAEFACMLIADRLSAIGPKALTDQGIVKYLEALWLQAKEATSGAARKEAAGRLERIIRSLLPDLRTRKDRKVQILEVTREVENAERTLRVVRRRHRHSPHALRLNLGETFKHWSPKAIDALAKALQSQNRHAVRKALYAGVGDRFNVAPGTLPRVVAEGRRLVRREREAATFRARDAAFQLRVAEGREHYLAWCCQEGISPPASLR